MLCMRVEDISTSCLKCCTTERPRLDTYHILPENFNWENTNSERVRQELVEGFVDRYSLGCDRGKYICDVSLSILD